jgi:hypothetical protein
MRSFFRTFSGLGVVTFYFSFLLTTTFVVQLLNPSFWIKNLKKPGVYGYMEQALKIAARDGLRENLKKEGINLENLTTGQRAIIEKEMDVLLNPITKENIQEFSEANINNILNFVNGKSERLIIYLPLKKWGIPSAQSTQLPEYLTNENLDLIELIDQGNLNMSKTTISSIKNSGVKIRIWWLISIISLSLTLFLHYVLGGKDKKLESTLSFMFYGGIITLFGAWILNVVARTVGEGLEAKRKAMEIFIGTIVPAILSETIKLWLIFGIATMLLTYFISYAANNINKNRQVKI